MAKAKRQHKYEPDYAVAPGEALRDTLESLGMAQKELAKRAGLTVQTISRILNGEQPITFETANKLEMVTGIPARMWNGLEMKYREQLSKIEERKRLEEDLAWLKSIPTRELVKRDILPETKDKVTLLHEALSFFGVSSVDACGTMYGWSMMSLQGGLSALKVSLGLLLLGFGLVNSVPSELTVTHIARLSSSER